MSITVLQVYQNICYQLMEDGGLVLGPFTDAMFMDSLSTVLLDFSQRAPLDKLFYTQRIQNAVNDYVVPDLITVPELVLIGGRLIERVSEFDLTQGHLQWRTRRGAPEQWYEDNLAPKHIRVTPTPDYTGTANAGTYGEFDPAERNLTIVGPGAPTKTTWVMGDTLDGIPDSFVHYLAYGILEQVFSAEGETRDLQRAMYCRTRYLEGIAISEAIAREELLEEDD